MINKCQDVPIFFQEAEHALAPLGEIEVIVRDIESCYPSMPKEAIRFGLLDMTRKLRSEEGREGVMVPKFSRTKPCNWSKKCQRGGVWLSFELMQAVMEFTLDNAIVAMPDGLRRQSQGIPMG